MEIENNIETRSELPETGKKKSKGLKIFSILLLFVVLIIFGYFAYFSVQAPYLKAKEFQKEYTDSINNPEKDSLKSKEILALENEIAFQRSDINLANSDSNYLIIDLIDSMMYLELKGIRLQESKIVDFSVSNFIAKLDPQILNNYISKPFNVERTVSTIEKMVLKTKIAPKNEEEAIAQLQADTIKEKLDFVRYTYYLDRDLEIEIVQDSINSEDYIKENKDILLKRKIETLKEIVNSAIEFKSIKYTPSIKIVLQQKDARTIFRSMPYNGMIALRLGFEDMPIIRVE
jgi:hypothetical protein